ncbi:MAG: hypothetical protein IJB97_07080 [Clostridia bacterium]|nr:hypothetical protein [Clostridia bacterium]
MAGFFKCMLRANTSLCGDLEGEMTKLVKGKLSISIEKGKVIAWITGQDDIELSKENVQSVNVISSNVVVKDLASGGGKIRNVNVYKLVMKDGKEGVLRLVSNSAYKVLALIQ